MTTPSDDKSIRRARLLANCDAIAWAPHDGQYLTAASEDGVVQCWDARKFGSSDPIWSVVAREYIRVSDICSEDASTMHTKILSAVRVLIPSDITPQTLGLLEQ